MHARRMTAALLLAALSFVAGCGGGPQSGGAGTQKGPGAAQTTEKAASGGEPIVIGVVTSLTGPLAATGVQVAAGVRLAAKEWNEKGGVKGRQVEVVVEDDAGNPSTAVNAFNKILGRKPVAMFAPTFTPLVMAMYEGIKQAGLPVFTSATGVPITKQPEKLFFRLRTNDEKAGRIIAQYAVQELKAKRPGILYPNNDYGKGGYQVIKTTLEELGAPPVAAETFTQTDKDVSAQLLKIKRAGADLLIAWTVPADSGLVAKQARQLDLGIPILGGPGFGTEEYLELAGEATDGIHVLLDAAVGLDEKTRPFVEAVKKNFPDVPVSFVVSTNYDGANMLLQAIEKAGTDPAAIRRALHEVKGYAGVSGPYSFDADGNGLHQGVLARWEGRKLVPLKTVNVPD